MLDVPPGATFRRLLLLVIAVVVHNIPEGAAVGVAFGSLPSPSSSTYSSMFAKARNLAIGIGLQNFPEV